MKKNAAYTLFQRMDKLTQKVESIEKLLKLRPEPEILTCDKPGERCTLLINSADIDSAQGLDFYYSGRRTTVKTKKERAQKDGERVWIVFEGEIFYGFDDGEYDILFPVPTWVAVGKEVEWDGIAVEVGKKSEPCRTKIQAIGKNDGKDNFLSFKCRDAKHECSWWISLDHIKPVVKPEPEHKEAELCELPIGNDWWGEAQRFDFYRTNETRDVNPGEWAVNPEGKIWFYPEGYPNKREILRAVLREVKPAWKPEVGKLAFYKSIVRVLNIDSDSDVVQIKDLISHNRFSTYYYRLREVKPNDWKVEIAPGIKVSAEEDDDGDVMVKANGKFKTVYRKNSTSYPDDLAAGLALLKAAGMPVKPYQTERNES